MADTVAAILGIPLGEATMLLEAAGGNAELAVELGLGGGGGFPMMEEDTNNTTATTSPLTSTTTSPIWPSSTIPEAWKNQRLDAFVSTSSINDDEIQQHLNGPCGVLAVVQAEMWLLALSSSSSSSNREERLTRAIYNILERIVMASSSADSSESAATTSNDKEPPAVVILSASDNTSTQQVTLTSASQSIRTAVQLVEAAAATARVTTPLVEGPHWLCSSELMCLLLRGSIQNGIFGAYDPISKAKLSFYSNSNNNDSPRIGLLSWMEKEQGIPVADDLKLQRSVYILHTGDHFVTMKQQKPPQTNTDLTWQIYDGLAQATTLYRISGNNITQASPAPAEHVESFVKKRVGQPDDLVQSRKTTDQDYTHWSFEVVPAVDDPSVQGPWDTDPQEPVWDYSQLSLPPNQPWRCATCYSTRFATMNFGMNEGSNTTTCPTCDKPAADCLWSRWLTYAELSPRMQRRARGMYAPKLELVLATLYPHATIAQVQS